mgnify:CR=1 FL=1
MSASVPAAFATRLEGLGATVVRHGDSYADSMVGAMEAAELVLFPGPCDKMREMAGSVAGRFAAEALVVTAAKGIEAGTRLRMSQVLADELPGFGRARMFADMDAWGYSFRLGAAQAWFDGDADDARQWLEAAPDSREGLFFLAVSLFAQRRFGESAAVNQRRMLIMVSPGSASGGHSRQSVASFKARPASTAAVIASSPRCQISNGGSAQIRSKRSSSKGSRCMSATRGKTTIDASAAVSTPVAASCSAPCIVM